MRATLLLASLLLISCRRGLPGDGMEPNSALPPATLTGNVTDRSTGKGLERASVTLTPRGGDASPKSFVTGSVGEYQFTQIAPGDYEITFSARGFQLQTTSLRLHPRQNRGLNVSMSPVAIPCPRVRVGMPLPGCG